MGIKPVSLVSNKLSYFRRVTGFFYGRFMRPADLYISSFTARALLWIAGVRFGKKLLADGPLDCCDGQNIILGDYMRFGRGVYLRAIDSGFLTIGSHTYVGSNCCVLAYKSVDIGENCLIAPGCYITDANHGTDPEKLIREQPCKSEPIKIGNDVWIGAGCSILPGVTIGDGAVVGSRSVVTHAVPPMAIVAGAPARLLRFRGQGLKD